MSDFVHLHLHTEFSLLDGACRIDEVLDQAVRLKMPAIAVTEHGNLFSSVIFHDHARARGLNPILGCEVYVAPGSRLDKSGNPRTAADLGLNLVCTNDVHYLREADHHAHDVLLCIGTGKGFTDPKRLRYDAKQFFLKSAEEMAEVFKDFPDALANTVRIAERCNVRIAEGENYLPNFDVPPGVTLDEYFERVARDGFTERLTRLRQLQAAGALRHSIDEYERR